MISHEHKFIFIQPKKTATSTLHGVLFRYMVVDYSKISRHAKYSEALELYPESKNYIMSKIKIATLGNCQTMALCWYIRKLNLKCTAKWIAGMLADYPFAKGRKTFKDQIDHNIYDKDESMSYLREVDYLIYQKIGPKTCNIWNHEKIPSYLKNDCKLISVSYMVYDPEDDKFLNGMKQRASKLNIDIPAHKFIEKHDSKITMQQNNHPHAFYFLELVREICKTTGWPFYKDDQYQNLIKEGYPFG